MEGERNAESSAATQTEFSFHREPQLVLSRFRLHSLWGFTMNNRRQFLKTATATALLPLVALPKVFAAPSKTSAAETAVKALFDSLTMAQRGDVCFPWNHQDEKRGLLRTFVANNWQITKHTVGGGFYTKEQQGIIADIFKNLVNPDWHAKFLKQLKDDSDGKPFGAAQAVAIFGEPGSEQFEFVLTGRHQTIRADGNTEKHVAFGGPIFYGHATGGDDDKPGHPGNVFWEQGEAANGLYKMLDDKQQKRAMVAKTPKEHEVGFRGAKIEEAPGLPVAELTGDVKKGLQKLLEKLIEPFRTEDRDEVSTALKAQGGLDQCRLSFFEDADKGNDKVWDNWRLEGPSFVWHFRGDPHVHVWVNVADDAGVKLNAK
jgi:hypothetical protein